MHYHRQAGENAIRRSAHQEAIVHLTKGLELLQTLPASAARDQQELQFRLTLGVSLINTKGYAALEVEHTYAHAWELCRQLEQEPQLFSALWGLTSFYFIRAKFARGLELGEQLLIIAERANDPELQIEASLIVGSVRLFYRGDVKTARIHLERVMALYEPELHLAHTFRYGQDPGIGGRLIATVGLWCAGYPDQALQRIQEAVALARDCVNPYDRALAYSWGAFLHQYRGEGCLLRAQAETAIELSTEHGFAFLLPWGRVARGWALIEEGAIAQGITEIRQGITTEQAFGAEFCLPYFLSLLAEAHRRAGQTEAGLQVLDEAFATVRAADARLHEAELYRLKGELTLHRQWKVESQKSKVPSAHAEAEAYFHKALEIARRQEAKSWELRAAMSLARLWREQGKIDDARLLLEEIYCWFTEGFDTKDLQDAEALLRELDGRVERIEHKDQATENRQEGEEARRKDGVIVQGSTFNVQRSEPILDPRPPIPNTRYSALSTQSLPSPAPSPQSPAPNLFRHEGDYWTLDFASEVCHIEDALGLRYLAHLLRHPYQEFNAVTLAGGDISLNPTSADRVSVNLDERSASEVPAAKNHLDPQLKAVYHQRLCDLQDELDEARAFRDTGRIERLQQELHVLTEELTQRMSQETHDRRGNSPAEQARLNVTRAIRRALRKITTNHCSLGRYLTQTIKTGNICVYSPPPQRLVAWRF
jgi:predicted ATPase